MNQIRHRIAIRAPKDQVFEALSTIDGLSSWWTRSTTGESDRAGGVIDFRFGEHLSRFEVEKLEAAQELVWACTDSAPDWVGTKVCFALADQEGDTLLTLQHRDWREVNDFFGHCSMKWATFLLSLKQYLEAGEGAPFPDDLHV